MASDRISSANTTLLTIANDYRQAGSLNLAIAVYQKAIELQSQDGKIYDLLGQTHAQKGDWEQAIANYTQALQLGGLEQPFWTYKHLGDALKESERLEEAVTNYQQAIALQPERPEVYDSLAQTRALQGEYELAIASYQQAIELGLTNSYWTYKNLGDALTQENRLAEAKIAYQKADELKDNTTQTKIVSANNSKQDNKWLTIHNLGDRYFKKQQWHQAIANYRQAIELNPDYFWSHYNLGRTLAELSEWEDVRVCCEKAIALKSDLAGAYGYLGKALFHQSQCSTALAALQKAVQLDSQQPGWVYEYLGDTLARLDHPQPSLSFSAQKIERDTWQKVHASSLRRLKAEFQSSKRIFILGEDCDLDAEELKLLSNEVTVAVDSSLSRLVSLGFIPTFYLVEDRFQGKSHQEQIAQWSSILKLIPREFATDFPAEEGTIFFNGVKPNSYPDYRQFSTDATQCTYTGITATHTCLQLACYLNFEDIYLIGVDENHPIYSQDLNLLQANGINLYNATVNSQLKTIPLINYYSLFPADVVYPRLLIIDPTRMGGFTATGQIKSTLFAEWSPESLLQVYSRGRDKLGLYTPGSFIDNHNEYDDLQQLLAQCRKFRPQIIYYRPIGEQPHLDEFAQSAINNFNIPVVIQIMDDWLDRTLAQNPSLYQQLDGTLRNLLQNSAARLSISAAMSAALKDRYGWDFIPIANCVDPHDWWQVEQKQTRSPNSDFVLRYVGGLADDMNFSSIDEIARVVSSLTDQFNIRLEIYTMSHWKAKAIAVWQDLPGVSIHDANLSLQDYRQLLAASDALIIAYNFDAASIRYVKYSMANKLPECLASGTPVLIYGSLEIATVAYGVSSNAVVAVTEQNTDLLREAITQLVEMPDKYSQLAQKAQQFVFEHHHVDQTRSRLTRIFRNCLISSN
ncbi:MAG: tetratricopeptide repeat protein [Pleurocapsa sp.]